MSKFLTVACLVFLSTFNASAQVASPPSVSLTGSQSLFSKEECARRLASIHPGITRSELQKVAYPDGGISTPCQHERYVLDRCGKEDKQVLKIDLSFECAETKLKTSTKEYDKQKVKSVSKAYFELPSSD